MSSDTFTPMSTPLVNGSDMLKPGMHEKALWLDGLLKNLPDSIYIKDKHCRYIMVNNAWAQHHNITDLDSVLGKTDLDFYSPELAAKLQKKDRAVLRNKEPQIGTIEKTEEQGESVKKVSMTRIPILDTISGEAIGVIGISKDTSTRTLIEKDLAYERDMLHTLLDHSHDAIYFKDLNSKYLRISKAHPAMKFIDTPEQAVGKSDFDYFTAEHAEQAFEDERQIIESGKPLLGLIENESGPRTTERWVLTSKLPMYDKQGEIIGTFGLSRDITEIKKYENELSAAKNELEEHVKERTIDLEKRIAQLDFLTSVSYEMAHCTEIEDLASVIIRSFSSRLYIGASALCIKNDKHLRCIGSMGIDITAATHLFLETAATLLHLEDITTVTIINDWQHFFAAASLPESLSSLHCCAAIPLLADKRMIGLLYLFSRTSLQDQLPVEEKVLLTLATHSAVSLSNAMYYKELEQKAQLEAELDAARSIQQRLTPRFIPEIPRIALKGLYSPAYEVGGDYLDYFKNDTGCWVVVIADVCGKGIPAALLMTLLRSAFRVEARHETSARNLLCAVNTSMQSNLDDRSFVTAVCLIINPDGTAMSYARAGHPRLIRITPSLHKVDSIHSDGMALGILPDAESFRGTIDELTIPLNNGEYYFIYTDGLTDAFNPQKNTYGNERLLAALHSFCGSTPDDLIQTVISDIKQFTMGAAYHDDLTLIGLSVSG